MLRQTSAGAAIGVAIVLNVMILLACGQQAIAHDKQNQPNSVCPGFVVLPNGHVVFSQEAADSDSQSSHGNQAMGKHDQMAMGKSHDQMKGDHHQSHGHGKGHGAQAMGKSHGQMKSDDQQSHGHGKGRGAQAMGKSHDQMKSDDHKMHKGHQSNDRSHLMGYQHGQAIVPQDKMLCVPVGSHTDTAWTAVVNSSEMFVTAVSMKGALAHNSRANEGLRFTIVPSDTKPNKVIQPSQVRVFVRMPHHDHRMVGGHGPANDPDVAGMVVQLDENGRYTLPTIDFSMAGPWLIEVQVSDGAETHKAYMAARVGEE